MTRCDRVGSLPFPTKNVLIASQLILWWGGLSNQVTNPTHMYTHTQT